MSYIQIKTGNAFSSAEELLQIESRLNGYIGELRLEKNNRCVVSDGSAAIYDSLGTVANILDEESGLIELLSTNLSEIVRTYSNYESEVSELFGSTPSFDWSILDKVKDIIETSEDVLDIFDLCGLLTEDSIICEWIGPILTFILTAIENFEEAGYTVNERMTAETVLETLIKLGEAALIVAALTPIVGPVAAGVFAPVVVGWIDKIFNRYAGKDLAETVSDEILDYQENKKRYGEEYANEQIVDHTKEFFEKVGEDVGNAAETVSDAANIAVDWFNDGMQRILEYGPLVA